MQKILVAFSSAYNRRQKFSKHFKILVQVGFTTSKVLHDIQYKKIVHELFEELPNE